MAWSSSMCIWWQWSSLNGNSGLVGRQNRKRSYIHLISEFLKPLTRYPVRTWRSHSVLWIGWMGVTDLVTHTPHTHTLADQIALEAPSSVWMPVHCALLFSACFVSSCWGCRAQRHWELISGSFLPLVPWTDIWLYSGGKGLTLNIPDLLSCQLRNPISPPSKAKSMNRVLGKFNLLSLHNVTWSKRGFMDQFPEFYFFLDLTVFYWDIKGLWYEAENSS